jgi:nucleoporin NUP159
MRNPTTNMDQSLGFKTFAGETKIKLLPSPWLADSLPSSTSSLLSISSKRGLLAAAGPSQLVIAETEAIRDCFTRPAKAENNIKEFTPALTIDVPRLSQVAFNSDGSYLIICADSGGGLAVYDTAALLQNKRDPTFQIGTEQIAVRALSPNPAPEFAHLVAVVLGEGQLMIANLQTKDFVSGANGNKVVKGGVTSVSWSNKGKQLVAGLADGSAFQMDPAGSPKAIIRQPPNVPPNHHVSTIVWLANEEFLMIHTPNTPPEADRPPDSIIHYVQTDKGRNVFNYQTVNDPAGPFGLNRTPPIHYICRLRGWHNLTDMLILSAVDSTDVGLITQSEVPLASGAPTKVYTGTSFADDSQRAGLPMSALGEMTDTTPIGMALDLSSKDKVPKPILGDEMDESPFPLPGLLLLNNEGVLCAWWVVNKAAVRENKIYPSLIVAEGSVGASTPASAALSSPQASPFGAPSAFGAPSTFGKPAGPAFGQPTFGSAGNVGFGGTSLLGQKASPWAGASSATSMAAPAPSGFVKPTFGASSSFGASASPAQSGFGKPAFSTPSAFGAAASTGTAFGATGGIGQKASPWGTAPTSGGAASAASPFGSSAGGASGFAKFGSATPAASPFGAIASGPTSTPAFATSGTTIGATPSTSFGMSTQPSFGSTVTVDSSTGGSTLGSKSIFGNTTPAPAPSLFGKPSLPQAQSQETDMMDDGDEKEAPKEEKKMSGLFGGRDFRIESTFKPDMTSKDEDSEEEEKTRPAPRKSLFGADFGAAIEDQQKPASPQIKAEETEKPSLFSIPAKAETAKPSLFGPGTPSSSSFAFGKPSSPFLKEPEPPQVTSKPQPSPSATTAPSSASKASSSEESGSPLAGSEAEAVEMPASDDESSEEEPEVEPEAALPPDPTTMKVSKNFYDFNPNAPSTQSASQPKAAPQPTPKSPAEEKSEVEPEAALPPDPTTMKVSKDFYNFNPNALPSQSISQPKPKAPSAPQAANSPFGKASTTPHGFPKAPTIFAPPAAALRESPRSPSPIRSVTAPIGKLSGHQAQRPPSRPISRQAARPTLQPEPSYTASDLSDDDDERIRLELAKPIDPTLKLEPFIAHQDYAGVAPKNDIGHAIERIFRDINSMVDTLGLNARSLSSFIEGHKTLGPDERNKEDLDDEDADEWTLVEIDHLDRIESELEQELDNEKLDEVKDKLAELDSVRKDLGRLRHKLQDIRKFLEQSKNPERKASLKNASLDPAHRQAQQELRDSFAGFQAKLVEAEEGVLVLKTKLASANGAKGGQVPTVEAVERTIRKMTEMAEKKSGDIDVLEVQMRRLGMNTSGQGSPTRPSSSRAHTTESSLRSSRIMGESFRSSRGFGDSVRSSRLGASVRSSPGKGKTFAFPDQEDEEAFKEKVELLKKAQEKKAWVLKTLGEAVRSKGTRVTQG